MKIGLWIVLFAGAAFCQSPEDSSRFDSADVHASPASKNPTMRGGALRGGRYEVRTATMVDLISMAYRMESDKVLGGPNWLDWDRFDILAKAPQATAQPSLDGMLRNLLADRFKLVVHKDTKPMPAFALTAGKGKPKMKEADKEPAKDAGGSAPQGCRGVPQNSAPGTVSYQVLSCHNMTMQDVAGVLQGIGRGSYLPDPVVDKTGLSGTWDFELKWTQRNRLAQAGPDGISLFDAVEKQLGLKLEAQKIPLPVLIVDSVNQQPTPNDPGVSARIPPPLPAEFEVANIKPSAPEVTRQSGRMQNARLDLEYFTLKELIQAAWDLPNNDEMLAGIPKSADSAHWDVVAKVATAGPAQAQDIDDDTLLLMLQGLLAERFGLKVHMEDRPVSAYTMTAAKQTKLQKADPQNRTGCKSGGSANPILNRLITCQNMNMTQFASMLQNMANGYVRAPIKDATGLDSYYDFSVNFSGINLLPGARFDPNATSGASDPNGSLSLPEALQKQLGLKLEMEKRPLPVLVVDHVDDKPTAN